MNALTLALFAAAQGPLVDPAPPAPRDGFAAGEVTVDGRVLPYRLLAPARMVPGERYPLILFLHGAGERGADNEKQLTHFARRMATAERRAELPCFVLAPQCPAGERWTNDDWGAKTSQPLAAEPTLALRGAIAALQEVAESELVALDRIYLTGISMGGYGAFELALRHPDWFAAVAPVCGGGDEREATRLAGLPLSVWHGDADGAVPVERSRCMVAALRALGEAPEYHELAGVGHDAWNHAYTDGGCLTWLFAQRRDPRRRMQAAARLMALACAPDERIAFLGDSITEGGASAGGYVDLLRSALAEHRPAAVVIPAGVSGNKVPDLLERYERDVLAHSPTLVLVYIGINDVWHSLNGRGTKREEFAPGLERLCRDLEARGGARCVLATASVIGEQRGGANELDGLLAEFVADTRGVATPPQRTLCDLHRSFTAHLALFNPGDERAGILTTDGVHLNGAGNILVATEVADALRRAVESRRARR